MIRKPRGIFITGTDTGVGKTLVTATIACAFQAQGISAGVMKPIETGVAGRGLSDSDWLVAVTSPHAARDLIAPYRLSLPASPLVAAAAQGIRIDPDRIMAAYEVLASQSDCLVIEGVGGIMVPITDDGFLVDLILMMQVPVLIVARATLGSINHSLLTAAGLRDRGVPTIGFVFNNPLPPSDDADTHRTIPTILQCTGLRSFGELPYCEGLPARWEQHRDRLISAIDVERLLEQLGLREVA